MSLRDLLRVACFLGAFAVCVSWKAGDSAADSRAAVRVAADVRQALQSGIELERSKRWLEAIEVYEQALETWPDNGDLKYGLRRTKIQFSIDRRYADGSFREQLLPLTRFEALGYFDDVVEKVQRHYVDGVSRTSLVAHGTESLYHALKNDRFVKINLRGVSGSSINDVRRILRERYWNKPVSYQEQGRRLVSEICDLARRELGMRSSAVVMEYVFGSCNALDDYSSYLTPSRLDDLYNNINGEFVGIGIEMKSEMGQGLLLVNVLPESPAAEGGARPGDHIVQIGDADCRYMTTDEAASLLQGEPGSRVQLSLEDADGAVRRTTLVRRPVKVKSIPVAGMVDAAHGIGYIRMTGFQKNSARELDASLAELQRQGARALIWDVRGNPGGLLTAAVEVLDRFIADGVLVSTHGRISDQNWTYSARRSGTWSLPLVLLVDGDSASASEIVAGAIHDHRRGSIVGRRTYGKWSVQSILPDDRVATGLRLTTAKFFSPSGNTYGKIGVEPDLLVEVATPHRALYDGDLDALRSDEDVAAGLRVLRKQLAQR